MNFEFILINTTLFYIENFIIDHVVVISMNILFYITNYLFNITILSQ